MNTTSHRVLLWNNVYEQFNSNPKITSFFKDDSLNHPTFFWEFQVIGLHWLKKEKKAAKARIILLGWSSLSLPVNWPRLPVSFTHAHSRMSYSSLLFVYSRSLYNKRNIYVLSKSHYDRTIHKLDRTLGKRLLTIFSY